jgi:hypothetical protein
VSTVGFTGEILRPPDLEYNAARRLWNAMIDKRPAVLARCRSTSDVVAALSQDTEQRLAMLTVSVQEYDIADARPVSG